MESQLRILQGQPLEEGIGELADQLNLTVNGRHGALSATSGWDGGDDFWIEYTFGESADNGNAEVTPRLRDERVRYTFGYSGDGEAREGAWRCQTTAESVYSNNCETGL
ncbi:hypothetical protein [Aquisalimonas sp. 2447]|uniref:hypothetical protein n=1 Tax=Aquisalimonas sp. 2447 TaxID=2740807 RepID=UPI00353006E1